MERKTKEKMIEMLCMSMGDSWNGDRRNLSESEADAIVRLVCRLSEIPYEQNAERARLKKEINVITDMVL